eukprot:TRINITY_DN1712_c0_g3_i1.p1 TRINITY_DN1712_c0_g3~~TRINITY_DN1712_c0_g3_i1.p1  ORF type:complete len:298 (-),score=63.54 TRINITY_DN1712_c0_g3_i1:113-1006(-)
MTTPTSATSGGESSTILLDPRIRSASIRSFDDCWAALLKLMFVSDRFFAFANDGDEISLFLDEDSLDLFAEESLVVSPEVYSAIQVFEGSHVINDVGYIHRYTTALAQSEIEILYLSTYYTNLLLIEENDCERALELLISPSSISPLSSPRKSSGGSLSNNILLTSFPEATSIFHFEQTATPQLTQSLLQLLVLSDHSEFTSITSCGGGVTVVAPSTRMEELGLAESALVSSTLTSWKVLQLAAGSAGLGVAMVDKLSSVLAANGVSIFYLSTVNDDFILVSEQDAKTVGVLFKTLL